MSGTISCVSPASRNNRRRSQVPARVRDIVAQVGEERGVSARHIWLISQRHPVAHARQEVWRRIRELKFSNGLPPSFPQIGSWFGKHHTTVMLGIRAAERRHNGGPA